MHRSPFRSHHGGVEIGHRPIEPSPSPRPLLLSVERPLRSFRKHSPT